MSSGDSKFTRIHVPNEWLYHTYTCEAETVEDVYKLLYEDPDMRRKIIHCNENRGFWYYIETDANKISFPNGNTTLLVRTNLECPHYDLCAYEEHTLDWSGWNRISHRYKEITPDDVFHAGISFEIFKNIVRYFSEIALGDYGDLILIIKQLQPGLFQLSGRFESE